jgi:serine/threonine protein kinase
VPNARTLGHPADAPLTDKLATLRVNESDFETLRVLGRGGFGEVRLVRFKPTRDVYAMKVLRKHKMRTEREVRRPLPAPHMARRTLTAVPWA